MVTRLLPESEWSRLDPEHMRLPAIEPSAVDCDVIVIEEDGEIIGCSTVMTCVHIEGTWIDPRYRRRVSVGRRLLHAMRDVVKQRGANGAWMCSVSENSRSLIEQKLHGMEVLGRHYTVTV